MKVLLTGATGFVGKALANKLLEDGYEVTAVVRECSAELPEVVNQLEVGDMSLLHTDKPQDLIRTALNVTDVVVHAAARVHIMDDKASDPLTEFRKVNVGVTLTLANMAANAGVKRFIFLSTAKVNGESTFEEAFHETDIPEPHDPYAISKWEAEQGLWKIITKTGMEVVIIRPPLIYGPGVKGNFVCMMRWIQKGIPLPLGAINNRRSLLALDNLISFIGLCMSHPNAANETFLIADGEDVSTTELLHKVACALGKKPHLIPISVNWMNFLAKLLGKQAVSERLFGSLQVDISKARERLGWMPVTTMEHLLAKMVEWEKSRHGLK